MLCVGPSKDQDRNRGELRGFSCSRHCPQRSDPVAYLAARDWAELPAECQGRDFRQVRLAPVPVLDQGPASPEVERQAVCLAVRAFSLSCCCDDPRDVCADVIRLDPRIAALDDCRPGSNHHQREPAPPGQDGLFAERRSGPTPYDISYVTGVSASGMGSMPSSWRTWANVFGSAKRRSCIIARNAVSPTSVKTSRGQR
jgi:hypothetical protein